MSEKTEVKKVNYKAVYGGGLYRCCTQTLMDAVIETEPRLGHRMECKHCEGIMVWRTGSFGSGWHWDDSDADY